MGNEGYRLELRLLQSWQLCRDTEVLHVATRQQRLIAALAILGPRPRSYLSGLLWPEIAEARAMESLRVAVHLVSRQVPGLLVNSGTGLSLNELVDVDLHRLRNRIAELGRAEASNNVFPLIQQLRESDLLPGWYEDWVLFEQTKLQQDRLHAYHLIARGSLARCDFESALEAAEAALAFEPLDESAVGLLIQAQRRQGNSAAALRAFEAYESRLKEEMGLVPSESIRRLAADIALQVGQTGSL